MSDVLVTAAGAGAATVSAVSAMPGTTAHRYAVYFAPPGDLHRFGGRWLGRDADSGQPVDGAGVHPIDDPRHGEWTRAPAHYGLHATLKAPFRLAQDTHPAMLDHAARAFARRRQPFTVPLALRRLRGFLALCLDADADARAHMHALADDAVREFDVFRAAPTPAELARRRPEELGAEARRMLDAWGYPYAFETFIFHITLTGLLDVPTLDAALIAARAAMGSLLATPFDVNAVSVFVQPREGADFVVARHYGFDGSTRDGAGAHWLGGA
jgi:putative phosphonate metabolism protein